MTERLTLNVQEVATALGISRTAAYKAVREGNIPGTKKFGRRVVISKVIFERYLGSDTPKPSAS